MVTRFNTYYMDRALFCLPEVIETAKERLADVDFDTLVGTGFSGGIVIPSLALALGKKFVLIRKETDDSHHGRGLLCGELGKRWIFVDDFVSSGKTRVRVIEKIRDAERDNVMFAERDNRSYEVSEMVGQYLYVNYSDEGPHFEPFDSEWEESL